MVLFRRDKNANSGFKSTNTCKCGIDKTAHNSLVRITGGILSKENAWPWVLSTLYNESILHLKKINFNLGCSNCLCEYNWHFYICTI